MSRRILVALDGSRRDRMTLAALPDVCSTEDELMLLSVSKPGSRQQVGMRAARAVTHFSDPGGTARLAPGRETPVFETEEQVRERQLARLNRYLDAMADALQEQGFRVRVQPIVGNEVAQAIIEFASDYQPGLIVMAPRRLDPRRFIFGSVSAEVTKSAIAPVLLLPAGTRG